MELATERLRIIPLNLKLFNLLLTDKEALESTLGLNHSKDNLDMHTQIAMRELYDTAKKNTDDYFWYTNWQIILKRINMSVGSACFMGRPDSSGTVEIGYGMNEEFQRCGYMTEAVKAMCRWAFTQPGVRYVTADTEKNNIASQRVLIKCGMEKYKETDEFISWRQIKPPKQFM